MSLRATPPALSLTRMRARCGPLALLVMAAMLLSLAPRRARAAEPEPEERETATAPLAPAVAEPPGVERSERAVRPQLVEPSRRTAAQPPETTVMSLPTGENKTGVSSKAISTPSGPGTLQGMGESFSAQPSTGIATFSVPFALPKARGAAQPSLSLGYGSSSGSGVAGVGWDVSVPFISRQTDRGLPAYQDQDAWHPNQDRFVYNGGQELVPIATPIEGEELPSWAHGWQYFRPRVEGSYLRFFWNRSLQSWRVQDKSGVVLELGGESNALETEPGNPSRVFRWNLRRQLDAFGNEVRYSYLHDGGTAYLQDIHDTSPAAGDTGLTQWAHHTRLVYETRLDPSTSFNRGWKVSRSLRLARVDVTSVASAGTGRELLRRYHLGYDDAYHVSLLASVQVEGRCEGQSIPEQSDGTLPGSACPRLPAMRFGYSHVGQPTPDGWEPIDSTVRSMQGSPKHSVDEDSTDLYDVNGDGLPDIVAMMPGSYGGRHGLWLNSAAGEADRFGPQTSLGVQGVLGGTESVLTKHNPNVAALDLDGDATIELVHMPKAKSYGVYTPRLIGSSWWWVGRAVTTADKLDAKIDFGTDAAELRVFDVNGDGLVDVVKTGGTSMQVWFALGRYPGGDGLFGSAQWTGADTAALSMNPVLRCVPWSATPVRFSDEDTRLADMNGDGLTDIVRVRQGDVKYWPGRGDGTFGTGELGCAGSTFSQGTFVQMASSPQYSDPNGSALHVDDVNGDGLSDLVQIRFNAVDVWLNVDGSRWTGRTVLSGTPASPGYQNRVRLVDMNGSGTRDILWGDGYAYKYIDLAAGQRPWLLTSIANGLGKTTEVQFTTSSAQMIAAEKGGKPWSRRAPIPLHMVSQVTVRDNLGAVGRPSGAYTTRYTYRDPVYDGLQREFRGFSRTEIETAGDANSPASVSSTEFLLGERPADHHGIDYTLPENRWRDNPREALKGLATVGESWDAKSKVHLSTTHASYRLRKLYSGKDGRSVWTAFEAGSDSLLYDTGAWVANGTTLSLPSIAIEDCSTSACTEDGSLAASVPARAAYVHVRKTVEVDRFGNRTVETAWGRLGTDESIVSETIPARVPTPDHALGEGGWAWRTVESRIRGSVHTAERRRTQTDYDGRGNPVETRAWLGDAGGLARSGPDGTEAGTAPFPPTASPPGFSGWIVTSHTWYDGFGNAVFETGAEGRCRAVGYDDAYRHLPTSETTYAGLADAEPVEREIGGISVSAACGTTELTTHAEYDLGLQALTSAVDPSGARTGVVYDGFGRMRELYAPSSWIAWESSVVPSLRVDYHLPDETGRPVSLLVSKTQDGADEGVADYHETYAFVDGLGRTVVTLSEADPGHDGFGWVVEGLTDYDQKGAPRRKYLAWEYSGPPEDYDLSMPSASKYGQQRYDAFGRAVETFGLDGRVTLRTRYHALSSDAWDAEDIGPGPHQGTFASEEKDGHGRVIRTTERVRVAQGIDTRHVESAYLPTGEVTSITRSHSGASVARTMAYDTLGRMTDNVAPETSSGQRWWRYVYDQAGDLVGTSDARGCGVNYGYDAAGRLVSEDYSPCQPNHEPYDAVPEVSYRYDEVDSEPDCLVDQGFTAGKLVSVTDRASKAVTQYDGRGRIQAAARRVNGPDGETGTRWYCKATAYDGANRPVLEQTGTDPPTEVITSYTRRGAVGSIGSTYGALVERVRRDADGLVTEIGYGDAAHTTTGFDYDDLRRLRNLTTYRAALPAGTPSETGQMLLQDEQYSYDRVGNPIEIRDYRIASEWAGAPAPVTRKMQYDDLYRLTRIDYQYPGGQDPWRDPYEAEQG
ncbi:MAG TPA: SpvB/TcaC N-terminal domain-containing protein, partial [Polyangiaceae bacterium]|nr:SpvB/TcaC N-terminal domain-containing protein [Polyangiaceae bacterium]